MKEHLILTKTYYIVAFVTCAVLLLNVISLCLYHLTYE